jgi:hypothetical protein
LEPIPFDWPQGAHALLDTAKQHGGLARLIMDGTEHIESCLIETRILPFLLEKGVKTLHFALLNPGTAPRVVTLMPLADGSAFGCATSGIWHALAVGEALHEIQHLGFRYAPSDRWQKGFEATLVHPDNSSARLTPSEVAKFWQETTGSKPLGYAEGVLDRIQASGLDVMDKLFKTPGQLGL